MMGTTSPGIAVWMWFLAAITILNLAVWLRAAVALQRERALQGPERRDYRRRQLILSALFVAGGAFRSIFPRADVQRICLYDNWLSVVLIGRAVATVAESLTAHLRLLPLLGGHIEIADISLERPRIAIKFDPSGRSNWAPLLHVLAGALKE